MSDYRRIYTGSIVNVNKIKAALTELDIVPVIKDQNESARLAGFGQTAPGQEVFLTHAEYEKASDLLEKLALE